MARELGIPGLSFKGELLELGPNGRTSYIRAFVQTLNPGNIPANSSTPFNFNVSADLGLVPGDFIFITPPSDYGAGLFVPYATVLSATQVHLMFYNFNIVPVAAPNGVYTLLAVRP